MIRRPLSVALLTACLVLPLGASRSSAESALRLPLPERFGEIDASTYDESGERVGPARLEVGRLPNGNVRLDMTSGFESSARIAMSAELAEEGDRLRLLRQESRSLDEQGRPLGVMSIDHRAGFAVCAPPGAAPGEGNRIALPPTDRVVNVPLNLLFQPLVSGDAREIDFQILLCRGGGRIFDARASLADEREGGEGMIEVRYDLDFGPMLSRLARPFMPRLSVWFDSQEPGSWIGHRMPLFSKGPTVLVVRSGITPSLLGAAR